MTNLKKIPDLFSTSYECCGCTACFSICPVNAIKMKPDSEGFLYPVIDEKACIGCKKCEHVCQEKSSDTHGDPITIFAAKNKNLDSRLDSSSGGVFVLLAEYMEKQGGVIYGAAFNRDFKVCHQRATTEENWKRFCKSKYVQSDLGESFICIKKDLENGIPVLFTGTPCQIEGLKRYLNRSNTEKLVTADIICHGVPSPKIWAEWLEYIEKKTTSKISRIDFRNKKSTGWHRSSLSLYGEDDDILYTGTHSENSYSKMYFKHLIIRPACHKCKYANFQRPADITLGDYWGVEKKLPDFDDDKGISLVMCNSEKGLKVWKTIADKIDYYNVDRTQCEQPNLLSPTSEPKSRKLFWKIYDRYGITAAMKFFKVVPLSRLESIAIKAMRMIMRISGAI